MALLPSVCELAPQGYGDWKFEFIHLGEKVRFREML